MTRSHGVLVLTLLLGVGLAPFAARAVEDLAQFLEREKTLYTHGQEEEFIRHFFGDRRDGVYLDVAIEVVADAGDSDDRFGEGGTCEVAVGLASSDASDGA